METAPSYRERLTPPWWMLLLLLLIAPASLLVFLPINTQTGIGVAIALYAGAVALLWLGAPVIAVQDGQLRAGRARIDIRHLGTARALLGADAQDAMRSGWDPGAHHVVSPWTRSLVCASVEDPEDPTTAWLISSRRPEALVAAIEAAR